MYRTSSPSRSSPSADEVLINGYLYDVTSFSHPGGDIIKFYVNNGEDATTAFRQFHNRSIKETLKILDTLPRRKAGPNENNNLPPETLERHRHLTSSFQKLFLDLRKEGYFDPSPLYIFLRVTTLLCFICVAFYLAMKGPYWFPHQLTGLLMLGVASGQCGWLMHEAGHYSLTGIPKWDRLLQSAILGLGTGFSAAWWRAYHNRHHAMPQRKGKDEDVSYLPLIAFNKETVGEEYKMSRVQEFFVKYQTLLYIPLDGFLIILWWRVWKSPRYALYKRAYLDLFFMSVHLSAVIYAIGPLSYLFVLWLTSIYTLGNLALNHTYTPVTDEETHWVEHALKHTVDIDPGPLRWVDYWMGYINYHVIHHLFPSIPLFRAYKIMPRIRKWAEEHDLPYRQEGYWKSWWMTLKNIDEIAKELRNGI